MPIVMVSSLMKQMGIQLPTVPVLTLLLQLPHNLVTTLDMAAHSPSYTGHTHTNSNALAIIACQICDSCQKLQMEGLTWPSAYSWQIYYTWLLTSIGVLCVIFSVNFYVLVTDQLISVMLIGPLKLTYLVFSF